MTKTLRAIAAPEAFGKLQTQMRTQRPGVELLVANSLWGRKGSRFQPAFLESLRTNFGGGFHEVDFQAGGADAVNQWVKSQTKDQIPDLLRPDDVNRLTRLILANAIYLKGEWASRFHNTRTTHFFPKPGESFPHPMMSQASSFRYAQTKTLQALEMPYVGDAVSMVVLLPLEWDGLSEVEDLLTPENWAKWLGWMEPMKVNVYFPRFKLDQELRLGDTLSAMGMPLAFDRDKADFSGIVDFSTNPNDRVHISQVIHKVRIEVDEAGAKAAGASAVILEAKSDKGEARVRVEQPPQLLACHPFVFAIRDRHTGAILFVGRVVDPRAK